MKKSRVAVYIDGFNYYHAIIHYQKHQGISTGLKWLDYRAYITNKILKNSDDRTNLTINFYTAVNSYLPESNQKRHEIYIEALKRSGVNIVRGFFKLREIGLNCHIYCPTCNTPTFVNNIEVNRQDEIKCKNSNCANLINLSICQKIYVPEEKKTDVNLAINIVLDAEKELFDKFILFSTDSDFLSAAEYVIQKGKEFIVAAPATKEIVRTKIEENGQHKPIADYRYKVDGYEKIKAKVERIRMGQLSHYQFPSQYQGLLKPTNW